MKWINLTTLAVLVFGGFNGFAAAFGGHEMDVVANVFGGDDTMGSRVVYAIVGLSALWQMMPFIRAWRISEEDAEANHHPTAAR